jgi:glycosyltransferase involved in cell wall biosynthesis
MEMKLLMCSQIATEGVNLSTAIKKPTITALICTLNEEKNLPHVLPRIPKIVNEILIIDGHSKDKTVEIAKSLCPDVRILYQPGKGKGDALRFGIEQSKGDIIVMLDADGSMEPAEIESFIQPLLNGFDYVKGSRFMVGGGTKDMSRHRVFGNWVFTTLTNIFYGAKYTDLCYGYNAFYKNKFTGCITIEGDGFEIETEMNIKAWKNGLKVIEVPSYESERLHGVGNLRSFGDGKRILLTIMKMLFQEKAV